MEFKTKLTPEQATAVSAFLALHKKYDDAMLDALRERMCLRCGGETPQDDCWCDYDSGAYDCVCDCGDK